MGFPSTQPPQPPITQRNFQPAKLLMVGFDAISPKNRPVKFSGGETHCRWLVSGGKLTSFLLLSSGVTGGGNSNIFGIFSPVPWGNDPILTSIFFKWVGSTTN